MRQSLGLLVFVIFGPDFDNAFAAYLAHGEISVHTKPSTSRGEGENCRPVFVYRYDTSNASIRRAGQTRHR